VRTCLPDFVPFSEAETENKKTKGAPASDYLFYPKDAAKVEKLLDTKKKPTSARCRLVVFR
jgi:hypothetical protein